MATTPFPDLSTQQTDSSPNASNTGAQRRASTRDQNSFFLALANAWGSTLNDQADHISELSDLVGNGGQDDPANISLLTAASLRYSFLSTSANGAITSVAQGLETAARKQ